MATRNTTENKRFVFRSPDKKPTVYSVSPDRPRDHIAKKVVQPQVIPKMGILSSPSPRPLPPPRASVNGNTSRHETTPARRVVVIRNTKHSQVNQGPVDLGDFGQPNSPKVPPVADNGVSIF